MNIAATFIWHKFIQAFIECHEQDPELQISMDRYQDGMDQHLTRVLPNTCGINTLSSSNKMFYIRIKILTNNISNTKILHCTKRLKILEAISKK